jgi:hypothetical protein
VQRTFPWIIVTVFLAGAVLVGLGIIAGSLLLSLLGTAAVVVAGLAAVILPRFGLSAPLSFSVNYPADAGHKQGTSGPPRDEPYKTRPEVPARWLPAGPDRERAKPQHVNLGPHERLRSVGGEEIIEIPEKEREE